MTPRKLADDLAELRDRLTDALLHGGLWNPELLEPQKLSLLLLNARDGLDAAVEALVRGAVPPAPQDEHERLKAELVEAREALAFNGARAVAAEEKLARFAQHRPECCVRIDKPCDCGFDTAFVAPEAGASVLPRMDRRTLMAVFDTCTVLFMKPGTRQADAYNKALVDIQRSIELTIERAGGRVDPPAPQEPVIRLSRPPAAAPLISDEEWSDWVGDCAKWRGELLVGQDAHWCGDWNGLPVDETSREYDCCQCFDSDSVFYQGRPKGASQGPAPARKEPNASK